MRHHNAPSLSGSSLPSNGSETRASHCPRFPSLWERTGPSDIRQRALSLTKMPFVEKARRIRSGRPVTNCSGALRLEEGDVAVGVAPLHDDVVPATIRGGVVGHSPVHTTPRDAVL